MHSCAQGGVVLLRQEEVSSQIMAVLDLFHGRYGWMHKIQGANRRRCAVFAYAASRRYSAYRENGGGGADW